MPTENRADLSQNDARNAEGAPALPQEELVVTSKKVVGTSQRGSWVAVYIALQLCVTACSIGVIHSGDIAVAPTPRVEGATVAATVSVAMKDRGGPPPFAPRNPFKPHTEDVENVLRYALYEGGVFVTVDDRTQSSYLLEVSVEHGLIFLGTAFDPNLTTILTYAHLKKTGTDLPLWGRVFASNTKAKGDPKSGKQQVAEAFQRTFQRLVAELSTLDVERTAATALPVQGGQLQGLDHFYSIAQRLFGFTADVLDVYVWNGRVPEEMVSHTTDYLPAATQVATGGGPPEWGRANTPLYSSVSLVPQVAPLFFYCSNRRPSNYSLFMDPEIQRELMDLAHTDVVRATALEAGLLAVDHVVARRRVGRLAYALADGAYVSEPVMPPETAEDAESIVSFMMQGQSPGNPATEIMIEGFSFCLDMRGSQLESVLTTPSEIADQRFDYQARFGGRANLAEFGELLSRQGGAELPLDSLQIHASGPATVIDSATVLAWLGEPRSRSVVSEDVSVWGYVDQVVNGQRHTAAVVMREGQLSKFEVVVRAESP